MLGLVGKQIPSILLLEIPERKQLISCCASQTERAHRRRLPSAVSCKTPFRLSADGNAASVVARTQPLPVSIYSHAPKFSEVLRFDRVVKKTRERGCQVKKMPSWFQVLPNLVKELRR